MAALMAARRLSHGRPHDPSYHPGPSLSHGILQEPGLIERFKYYNSLEWYWY